MIFIALLNGFAKRRKINPPSEEGRLCPTKEGSGTRGVMTIGVSNTWKRCSGKGRGRFSTRREERATTGQISLAIAGPFRPRVRLPRQSPCGHLSLDLLMVPFYWG